VGILSWIVFGLIAGGLAKLIMPGKQPGGCIVTMLLGIGGGIVGGMIGTALGWGNVGGFDIRSLFLGILGSLLLLVIYGVIVSRKAP
jgi:uncharacterized membrane protein YeaQ/YmgE (transglycosylase-associated protein family)